MNLLNGTKPVVSKTTYENPLRAFNLERKTYMYIEVTNYLDQRTRYIC
jgi:hypothetical protein